MHHDFTHAYGESQGWQEYSEYLHHGLFAIRRRLGLQRFAELTTLLDVALHEQQATGSTDAHMSWLVPLLNEYYDPMYRYQLKRKPRKSSFAAHGRRWLTGLAYSNQCLSRLSARSPTSRPAPERLAPE